MRKVRLSVRIVVASVFLYAGFMKTWNPAESVLALRSLEFPLLWAEALVFIVSVAEVQIALNLLFGWHTRYAAGAALVCLGAFLVFLLYLLTLANPPNCGCPDLIGLFRTARQSAWFGVFRNIALITLVWYFLVPSLPSLPLDNRKARS